MPDVFSSYLLRHSVSNDDRLFFVQNLALMLRAGISLPRAMEILAEESRKKGWKKIQLDVRENLVRGNSLEKCLEKYPEIFGDSLISMVRIGELKGDLPAILDAYYLLLKKEEHLRKKLKGALTYPTVVLVAIVLLGVGAVYFVFPRIAELFLEVNAELPLPTRLVIWFTRFMEAYGVFVFLGLASAAFLFFTAIRTPRGKFFFDLFLLRAPIAGGIVKQQHLARLMRNLGVLLHSGVPIGEAITTTSGVMSNVFYRQSLLDARDEIIRGNFLFTSFMAYKDLYPGLVVQIIRVGEEAGMLDDVLSQVADFYEEKAGETLENLTAVLEPVLILFLGAGVAFAALSILLPIYRLAEVI